MTNYKYLLKPAGTTVFITILMRLPWLPLYKLKLKTEHTKALPDFFKQINDPRQASGKLHPLPAVLALATAAVLCGMKGYKGISDWIQE